MAGLDPDCAFMQVTDIMPTHKRSTRNQVVSMLSEVTAKARKYAEEGDDRLFAFVNQYLIQCLIMHDPKDAPEDTTGKRAHVRRNTEARIAAYRKYGWSAFVVMLTDYRELASKKTLTEASKSTDLDESSTERQ